MTSRVGRGHDRQRAPGARAKRPKNRSDRRPAARAAGLGRDPAAHRVRPAGAVRLPDAASPTQRCSRTNVATVDGSPTALGSATARSCTSTRRATDGSGKPSRVTSASPAVSRRRPTTSLSRTARSRRWTSSRGCCSRPGTASPWRTRATPPRDWRSQRWACACVGVPVDREGLVVDALPTQARAVYVTPSHQYPLGVSMSLPRRLALLAWAERHNAAIIEDDYDSEFRFGGRPIEPLQTLDTTGRVIYVGSFSKTLLPTLRLGFVVAPPSLREARSQGEVRGRLAHVDHHPGRAGALHRRRRVRPSHPQDARSLSDASSDDRGRIGAAILPTISRSFPRPSDFTSPPSRAPRPPTKSAPSCAGRPTAGVAVQELSRFGVDAPGPPGLVLGYGAIPTARIEDGLQRLRSCF